MKDIFQLQESVNLDQFDVHDIKEIFQKFSFQEINQRFFPILYTKDNKGKYRQWRTWLEPDGENAVVHIEYGLISGQKIHQTELVTQGKNIGKRNETTPHEQAFIIARKYYRRQIDKGYVEDFKSLDQGNKFNFVQPMLAQDFHKHSHKIEVPFIISPKLDGIRALAQNVDGNIVFKTRRGKSISSVGHLGEQLQGRLNEGEVIDGELYNHSVSFQELTSKIRKENQTDYGIEFHVFDYVSNEDYVTRWSKIKNIVQSTLNVFAVPYHRVDSFEEVRSYHDHYVSEGHEGIMVRNIEAGYEPGKRSYNLQKFKDFQDDEFPIVDVVEGKNNQGIFVCKTQDSQRFNVRPKGTDEFREWILNNKEQIIGKELTVRYFGYSEDGIPRFPVGVQVNRWSIE